LKKQDESWISGRKKGKTGSFSRKIAWRDSICKSKQETKYFLGIFVYKKENREKLPVFLGNQPVFPQTA